jgi:hypothetical protein
MSVVVDLTALATTLSPLVVTIINESINNKLVALIVSVVIILIAVFVVLYTQCKMNSGSMDSNQMLIDTAILSVTAIVFAFLYSISGTMPMGKIISSMIGLIIAMVIAYGVYTTYYLVKTTKNCA